MAGAQRCFRQLNGFHSTEALRRQRNRGDRFVRLDGRACEAVQRVAVRGRSDPLELAAAGIYGVFSQFVGLRTQELGVRVALGASTGQVAGMVLWRTVQLALYGVAFGVLAALWLGRVLAGQLHGVPPHDPVTMGAVAALVIAVAFLAATVPTIRAIRVDPVIALRQS